ncbi:Uma2 family endonuclease [Paenibacillus cymbidii]|uniref:Uma2 family endonuclease n=1 Tax=Paenibacillus cymbidii TaxID=1639034 RepID=UPI001081C260|nr:Uma2 family endonuclease [Paenibacillus cymbidii]
MEYDKPDKKKPLPLIKESGWTVEDYYNMPDDGNRYELVDGKLELMTSPLIEHQLVSKQLENTLTNSCENEYVILHAPVDVVISQKETRQPDILMIHRSRQHIIEVRNIVGPPDLVVEIVSPSTVKRDRVGKLRSYARFGVPEYWIVDPMYKTLEQYVLIQEGEPYVLEQFYEKEEVVRSSRLPCVSFRVCDGLTYLR